MEEYNIGLEHSFTKMYTHPLSLMKIEWSPLPPTYAPGIFHQGLYQVLCSLLALVCVLSWVVMVQMSQSWRWLGIFSLFVKTV